MLPDWSPPSGHYSFHCRQEAWELLRQSDSNWERSVPDVADATRSPDPSTVRRWAGRLMRSGNPAGGEALAGYPLERLDFTHHPCLGLDGDPPYSAVGGEKSVSRKALDELKQQIPLLDYLEAHDWRPARQLSPRPTDRAMPWVRPGVRPTIFAEFSQVEKRAALGLPACPFARIHHELSARRQAYHCSLTPSCVVLAALPEFRVERIPVSAIEVGLLG